MSSLRLSRLIAGFTEEIPAGADRTLVLIRASGKAS
jgi:hypothetical protein